LDSAWLKVETQTWNGETYVQGDRNMVDRTVSVDGTTALRYVESYRYEFPGAMPDIYQILAWTDEGLMLYRQVKVPDESVGEEGRDETYSPPLRMFPRRMDVGDTVSFASGRMLVEGLDDVTVPAGTFEDCLRLRIRTEDGDRSSDETSWLARGVGLVKVQGTEIEGGVTEIFEIQLVAARIGNTLYGHPNVGGRLISFALSAIEVSGCSILLDGITLAGLSDFYWARFDFNPATLSFVLAAWGEGTQTLGNQACAGLPLLSLDAEEPVLWDWTSGYVGTAAFSDRMEYGGFALQGEFSFSETTLAFELVRLWDGSGTLLYQAP
jgi:hypothetical protein